MSDAEELAWLAAARCLLARACGVQLGQVRVILAYTITGEGIEFTLPPFEGQSLHERFTTAGAPAAVSAGLTPTDREIVEVAEDTAHKPAWFARRLNRECNSYLRSRLTFLTRLTPPLLVRGAGGYRRPPAA